MSFKVVFHANDGSRKTFEAKFRSEKLADRFIDMFQYIGEYKRFEVDIIGKTSQRIPTVSCNMRGFIRVYDELYNR